MKEKIRWVVPMLVVILICCSCTGNDQILTSINHYVIKADMNELEKVLTFINILV